MSKRITKPMTKAEARRSLKHDRCELVRELRKVHGQLSRGQHFSGNVVDILNGLIFLHELKEGLR